MTEQQRESVITAPTKMAEVRTSAIGEDHQDGAAVALSSSMVEEMRKTGGLNNAEKAERLEEIVEGAA